MNLPLIKFCPDKPRKVRRLRDGRSEVLIRWKDYGPDCDTWEPLESLPMETPWLHKLSSLVKTVDADDTEESNSTQGTDFYRIEKLLFTFMENDTGHHYVYIKWEHYSIKESTWEPIDHIVDREAMIPEIRRAQKRAEQYFDSFQHCKTGQPMKKSSQLTKPLSSTKKRQKTQGNLIISNNSTSSSSSIISSRPSSSSSSTPQDIYLNSSKVSEVEYDNRPPPHRLLRVTPSLSENMSSSSTDDDNNRILKKHVSNHDEDMPSSLAIIPYSTQSSSSLDDRTNLARRLKKRRLIIDDEEAEHINNNCLSSSSSSSTVSYISDPHSTTHFEDKCSNEVNFKRKGSNRVLDYEHDEIKIFPSVEIEEICLLAVPETNVITLDNEITTESLPSSFCTVKDLLGDQLVLGDPYTLFILEKLMDAFGRQETAVITKTAIPAYTELKKKLEQLVNYVKQSVVNAMKIHNSTTTYTQQRVQKITIMNNTTLHQNNYSISEEQDSITMMSPRSWNMRSVIENTSSLKLDEFFDILQTKNSKKGTKVGGIQNNTNIDKNKNYDTINLNTTNSFPSNNINNEKNDHKEVTFSSNIIEHAEKDLLNNKKNIIIANNALSSTDDDDDETSLIHPIHYNNINKVTNPVLTYQEEHLFESSKNCNVNGACIVLTEEILDHTKDNTKIPKLRKSRYSSSTNNVTDYDDSNALPTALLNPQSNSSKAAINSRISSDNPSQQPNLSNISPTNDSLFCNPSFLSPLPSMDTDEFCTEHLRKPIVNTVTRETTNPIESSSFSNLSAHHTNHVHSAVLTAPHKVSVEEGSNINTNDEMSTNTTRNTSFDNRSKNNQVLCIPHNQTSTQFLNDQEHMRQGEYLEGEKSMTYQDMSQEHVGQQQNSGEDQKVIQNHKPLKCSENIRYQESVAYRSCAERQNNNEHQNHVENQQHVEYEGSTESPQIPPLEIAPRYEKYVDPAQTEEDREFVDCCEVINRQKAAEHQKRLNQQDHIEQHDDLEQENSTEQKNNVENQQHVQNKELIEQLQIGPQETLPGGHQRRTEEQNNPQCDKVMEPYKHKQYRSMENKDHAEHYEGAKPQRRLVNEKPIMEYEKPVEHYEYMGEEHMREQNHLENQRPVENRDFVECAGMTERQHNVEKENDVDQQNRAEQQEHIENERQHADGQTHVENHKHVEHYKDMEYQEYEKQRQRQQGEKQPQQDVHKNKATPQLLFFPANDFSKPQQAFTDVSCAQGDDRSNSNVISGAADTAANTCYKGNIGENNSSIAIPITGNNLSSLTTSHDSIGTLQNNLDVLREQNCFSNNIPKNLNNSLERISVNSSSVNSLGTTIAPCTTATAPSQFSSLSNFTVQGYYNYNLRPSLEPSLSSVEASQKRNSLPILPSLSQKESERMECFKQMNQNHMHNAYQEMQQETQKLNYGGYSQVHQQLSVEPVVTTSAAPYSNNPNNYNITSQNSNQPETLLPRNNVLYISNTTTNAGYSNETRESFNNQNQNDSLQNTQNLTLDNTRYRTSLPLNISHYNSNDRIIQNKPSHTVIAPLRRSFQPLLVSSVTSPPLVPNQNTSVPFTPYPIGSSSSLPSSQHDCIVNTAHQHSSPFVPLSFPIQPNPRITTNQQQHHTSKPLPFSQQPSHHNNSLIYTNQKQVFESSQSSNADHLHHSSSKQFFNGIPFPGNVENRKGVLSHPIETYPTIPITHTGITIAEPKLWTLHRYRSETSISDIVHCRTLPSHDNSSFSMRCFCSHFPPLSEAEWGKLSIFLRANFPDVATNGLLCTMCSWREHSMCSLAWVRCFPTLDEQDISQFIREYICVPCRLILAEPLMMVDRVLSILMCRPPTICNNNGNNLKKTVFLDCKLRSQELMDLQQGKTALQIRAFEMSSSTFRHIGFPIQVVFRSIGVGTPVEPFAVLKPPGLHHKRKEEPKLVPIPYVGTSGSARLVLECTFPSQLISNSYIFSLVLVRQWLIKDIFGTIKMTSSLNPIASRRLCKTIMDRNHINSIQDDDVMFERDDINLISLRCPSTLMRIGIPARGLHCMHIQCFDLEFYLYSQTRISSHKNRWKCPVCFHSCFPHELMIDTFFKDILLKTQEADRTVFLISKPEGVTWKVIEKDDTLLCTPQERLSTPMTEKHDDASSLTTVTKTLNQEYANSCTTTTKVDAFEAITSINGNNLHQGSGNTSIVIDLD